MRKREKVKKGVYYEGRPTKQLLQHLGGFCLATQCTVHTSGKGGGPVFVLTNTNTRLVTKRAKLIIMIAFLKSVS